MERRCVFKKEEEINQFTLVGTISDVVSCSFSTWIKHPSESSRAFIILPIVVYEVRQLPDSFTKSTAFRITSILDSILSKSFRKPSLSQSTTSHWLLLISRGVNSFLQNGQLSRFDTHRLQHFVHTLCTQVRTTIFGCSSKQIKQICLSPFGTCV